MGYKEVYSNLKSQRLTECETVAIQWSSLASSLVKRLAVHPEAHRHQRCMKSAQAYWALDQFSWVMWFRRALKEFWLGGWTIVSSAAMQVSHKALARTI